MCMGSRNVCIYLQHLQLLQPTLHQLLHLPLVGYGSVLAKGIFRSPFGVFTEVVEGELIGMAEERAVLDEEKFDF